MPVVVAQQAKCAVERQGAEQLVHPIARCNVRDDWLRSRARRVGASDVDEKVAHDGVQPIADRTAVGVELGCLAPRTDEGFLQRIFRSVTIMKRPASEGMQARRVRDPGLAKTQLGPKVGIVVFGDRSYHLATLVDAPDVE